MVLKMKGFIRDKFEDLTIGELKELFKLTMKIC